MRRLTPLLAVILGLSAMASWSSAHTLRATDTHSSQAATSALVSNRSSDSARASAPDIDLFTFLGASRQYPRARGDSEFDIEGARREVEVTVTGISGLAGKRVTVYISGIRVGTMLVSSRGQAHREWSTAHRQLVPTAGVGSAVRVRTAGGTLIVSGAYHRDVD